MKLNSLHVLASIAGIALMLSQSEARERKVQIGSEPEKFTFKDIHYLSRTLDDYGQGKIFVLVFTTTSCPLAQRYLPRLKDLSTQYRERGVQFISVNVGPDDSVKEVAYQALQQGIDFPFVKDFDGESVRALGAQRTPEVIVFDAQHKLRYRGRIDSQYRLSGVKPSPGREDLKEALEDILAGRKVRVKETPVDGCAITVREPNRSESSLTYAKDVAPLLNKNCVPCHR